MKRKIIVAVAVVLMLGVASYVVSEQKMPAVSAASTPESTSVAAPASEANIVQGETNSEENNSEGSVTVPEKPVGYDSPEYNSTPKKIKIVSGPNAGQTIDWPSNDQWGAMSAEERQRYDEMRDPDLYRTARRAGESDAEYRARLATYRTQEQLDDFAALQAQFGK